MFLQDFHALLRRAAAQTRRESNTDGGVPDDFVIGSALSHSHQRLFATSMLLCFLAVTVTEENNRL